MSPPPSWHQSVPPDDHSVLLSCTHVSCAEIASGEFDGRPPMTSPSRSVISASFLGCLSERVQDRLCRFVIPYELSAGQMLYDPDLTIVVEDRLRAFLTDGSATTHSGVSADAKRARHRPGSGTRFPRWVPSSDRQPSAPGRPSQVDEFGHSTPDLGWAIARQIAHYLDDVLAETSRVAFHLVRTRGAHHLLQLSSGQASAAVHQADPAAAVASVREVVACALVPLPDNGLVSVRPTGVTIIDATRIQHITAGCGESVEALILDTFRFAMKLRLT